MRHAYWILAVLMSLVLVGPVSADTMNVVTDFDTNATFIPALAPGSVVLATVSGTAGETGNGVSGAQSGADHVTALSIPISEACTTVTGWSYRLKYNRGGNGLIYLDGRIVATYEQRSSTSLPDYLSVGNGTYGYALNTWHTISWTGSTAVPSGSSLHIHAGFSSTGYIYIDNITITCDADATPTPSPTFTPTETYTPSPTHTPEVITPAVTPTITPTFTPSPTRTLTPTITYTPSWTPNPSATPNDTATPTFTPTVTFTPTPTWTPAPPTQTIVPLATWTLPAPGEPMFAFPTIQYVTSEPPPEMMMMMSEDGGDSQSVEYSQFCSLQVDPLAADAPGLTALNIPNTYRLLGCFTLYGVQFWGYIVLNFYNLLMATYAILVIALTFLGIRRLIRKIESLRKVNV